MTASVQSIRGFSDVLPGKTPVWRFVEETAFEVLTGYGYQEIRLPLVERTDLFARSIGEITDIVEKEMYTFLDRSGDSLSLRPEGTAGCVRACVEHGLLHGSQVRLWYCGPMFRYERPQRGRSRQFHQVGAEVFGAEGPDIDAEMILMTARLLRRLGLRDVELQLNSLGSTQSRVAYRARLVEYLSRHSDVLDEDSRRRLATNPLRILDSKNPAMQEIIAGAPNLLDSLDPESQVHFTQLRELLDVVGLPYVVNPRLVRGLDYYSRTVFEWGTNRLGAQGTVLAGGRYDALVEQMGGKPTPALGFAAGIERLVELLEEQGNSLVDNPPHACVVMVGDKAVSAGMSLSEKLRDELPWVRLVMNAGGGSFKSQFKRADRHGARFAFVLAESEVAAGEVTVKDLRGSSEQVTLSPERLVEYLKEHLGEQVA